jgi:carboxyl-terminal processing protease
VETSKDSILKEKRDRWHEGLAKDIYVEEEMSEKFLKN